MLIIASKPGQLGNRLFRFAHFIGSAREHGFGLMNPAFDEYAEYFEATDRDLFCRYPARRSLVKGSPRARRLLYHTCYYAARALVKVGIRSKTLRTISLDWEETLDLCAPEFLSSVKRRRILFMQGWQFNAHSALARHADAIRDYFRPREEFRANVSALIGRARTLGDVLVGVHIRHGDYRTHRDGKYFYELETYGALMEHVRGLFPDRKVAFLICSNAEQDEKILSRFNHLTGTGHLIEDLYALAECDYILGPPSTYTMWASFYGGVPLYTIEDPRTMPSLDNFRVYGVEQTVAKPLLNE
jgi:hypothetical protein